jgi:hypothetical protein
VWSEVAAPPSFHSASDRFGVGITCVILTCKLPKSRLSTEAVLIYELHSYVAAKDHLQ